LHKTSRAKALFGLVSALAGNNRSCPACSKNLAFVPQPALVGYALCADSGATERGRAGGDSMFSKARLDTLSDGIFGVAMTLLVLDVRLPENFHPHDGNELLKGLFDLWPKLVPLCAQLWRAGPALARQYRDPLARRIRQP
jgi:hypothetical protein